MRPTSAAAIFATVAAIVGTMLLPPVSAEIAEKGGVRVAVVGRMNPTNLPRSGGTPVAVSITGHITPTTASSLPRLNAIAIAINSHGKLRNRSIPLCRLGHIDPSTSIEALSACRPSLIGEGRFSANLRIPEQSPFPSEGKVLAFNGRLGGKPAMFAHIYGTKPVPTSYVLPFLITSSSGTYGTLLKAFLPNVTGEWGYVNSVSLNLQSRLVSASCPAPDGFPGTVFPLMRTTFGFDGGLKLQSTLTRSCRVRR